MKILIIVLGLLFGPQAFACSALEADRELLAAITSYVKREFPGVTKFTTPAWGRYVQGITFRQYNVEVNGQRMSGLAWVVHQKCDIAIGGAVAEQEYEVGN